MYSWANFENNHVILVFRTVRYEHKKKLRKSLQITSKWQYHTHSPEVAGTFLLIRDHPHTTVGESATGIITSLFVNIIIIVSITLISNAVKKWSSVPSRCPFQTLNFHFNFVTHRRDIRPSERRLKNRSTSQDYQIEHQFSFFFDKTDTTVSWWWSLCSVSQLVCGSK